MTNSKLLEPIVDSAIVVALVSAACYAVGYGGYLRNTRDLGLPSHLLPTPSIEAILLAGAADLWLLAAGGTILSAMFVFGHERLNFLQKASQKWRERWKRQRRLYVAVIVIIFVAVTLSYPYWAPFQRSPYRDETLPSVVDIQPRTEFAKTVDLKYLTRADGFFVLKENGTKNYFLVKEDDLTTLQISGSQSKKE